MALISQDILRWGFHLIGRSVPEVADGEHIFANQNAMILFERYLQSGKYTIVIEGLYTWADENSSQGSAKKLVALARKYGYEAKSIVLRASKEELLQRNQARQYSVPLDEFTVLYDNVYANVNSDEIVLDSTGQTPEETLEALKALV